MGWFDGNRQVLTNQTGLQMPRYYAMAGEEARGQLDRIKQRTYLARIFCLIAVFVMYCSRCKVFTVLITLTFSEDYNLTSKGCSNRLEMSVGDI